MYESLNAESGGLLAVDRVHLAALGMRSNPERVPFTPLTVADVLHRYRGIDGRAWPEPISRALVDEASGLAPLNNLGTVVAQFRQLATGDAQDLLFIAGPGYGRRHRVPDGFTFAGYDLGFATYSVLLNEVIFGVHEPMEAFASTLNDALLMDSVPEVQALQAVRNALLTDGADLETARPVVMLEVYALNRAYSNPKTGIP